MVTRPPLRGGGNGFSPGRRPATLTDKKAKMTQRTTLIERESLLAVRCDEMKETRPRDRNRGGSQHPPIKWDAAIWARTYRPASDMTSHEHLIGTRTKQNLSETSSFKRPLSACLTKMRKRYGRKRKRMYYPTRRMKDEVFLGHCD